MSKSDLAQIKALLFNSSDYFTPVLASMNRKCKTSILTRTFRSFIGNFPFTGISKDFVRFFKRVTLSCLIEQLSKMISFLPLYIFRIPDIWYLSPAVSRQQMDIFCGPTCISNLGEIQENYTSLSLFAEGQ